MSKMVQLGFSASGLGLSKEPVKRKCLNVEGRLIGCFHKAEGAVDAHILIVCKYYFVLFLENVFFFLGKMMKQSCLCVRNSFIKPFLCLDDYLQLN